MTGDPLKDYDRYEAEQARNEMNQPHCCICGEPIWDDALWDFMDALYCDDCARDRFRRWTDDYIKQRSDL